MSLFFTQDYNFIATAWSSTVSLLSNYLQWKNLYFLQQLIGLSVSRTSYHLLVLPFHNPMLLHGVPTIVPLLWGVFLFLHIYLHYLFLTYPIQHACVKNVFFLFTIFATAWTPTILDNIQHPSVLIHHTNRPEWADHRVIHLSQCNISTRIFIFFSNNSLLPHGPNNFN